MNKKIIIIIISLIIISIMIYFFIAKEKISKRIPTAPTGNLTPICGDGKCDRGEYDFNCCKDCGCNEGYICKDNTCTVDLSKITITKEEAIDIFKKELLKQDYIKEINESRVISRIVPKGYFICYDMTTESMKKQGFIDMICASVDNDKNISKIIRTI